MGNMEYQNTVVLTTLPNNKSCNHHFKVKHKPSKPNSSHFTNVRLFALFVNHFWTLPLSTLLHDRELGNVFNAASSRSFLGVNPALNATGIGDVAVSIVTGLKLLMVIAFAVVTFGNLLCCREPGINASSPSRTPTCATRRIISKLESTDNGLELSPQSHTAFEMARRSRPIRTGDET